METEIEATFPDIDTQKLREKLTLLGATKEHGEMLMRRENFDFPDESLDKINGWVRVRDEGNQITLSYKQLLDRTIHGTKEATVVVNDFEKATAFLRAIGMTRKVYQETKREKWLYKNVEVTIDTWPWIPSFVELEGPSEDALKEVARDLGLDWTKAMHGSVENVYQMHYDFTDHEIDHWPEITFIPEPDWLLARKKKAV